MSRRIMPANLRGVRWLLLIAFPMLAIVGCRALDPDYAFVTREDSTTRLVQDSPEVRRLLQQAGSGDAEMSERWRKLATEASAKPTREMDLYAEQYVAERKELRDRLERQPGISVTGAQYFRQIGSSTAACDSSLIPSHYYI